MSSVSDLKQKLTSLSRQSDRFEDGARIVSKAGLPTPLQAILKEIDETVLGRDVTFDFGNSGSITLVVTGRRLLGVRAIDGLAMPGIVEQIVGNSISGDDDPTLRALKGVLLQLDLLSATIATTSVASEVFGNQSDAGITVEKLATGLSVEYPFTMPSKLQQFASLVEPSIIASIFSSTDGEQIENGDDEPVEWIEANWDMLTGTFAGDAPRPRIATIGQNSGENRFACVAADAESVLVLLHSPDQIGRILSRWHQIFES